jgi:hypothetical protein
MLRTVLEQKTRELHECEHAIAQIVQKRQAAKKLESDRIKRLKNEVAQEMAVLRAAMQGLEDKARTLEATTTDLASCFNSGARSIPSSRPTWANSRSVFMPPDKVTSLPTLKTRAKV